MSEFEVYKSRYGSYEVSLPHQCDEWSITSTKNYKEAVEDLEDFIKDAQEALVELKKLKEEPQE